MMYLSSAPEEPSGGIPVLEWLASGLTWWFDLLAGWYDAIVKYLPDSPFLFVQPPPELVAVMPAINWLIPVGDMMTMTAAWLGCVGIVYAVIIALRWIKAL